MFSRRSGLRAVLAVAAALVLATGAIVIQGQPSSQEALLRAAPAELALPADPQQLGAWCAARKAQGTAGLSLHARAWLNDCITLFGGPTPTPSATQSASPSPSPTVQPSPSVSPTATTAPPPATTPPPSPSPTAGLNDCLNRLAECGFPHAGNTGPTGTLAASTRTQYSTAGETVTDMDISGCVEVHAADVTFRNVRIAAPCFWAVRSFAAGAVFDDVEISCQDTPGSNGYSNGGGGSVTLRRADIHHCENGLNVPGDTALIDSWVHDLYDGGDAHTDGAQFNQGAANIRFEHNTIDVRGNTSSAVTMWDEVDPQNRDVLFDRNLFIDGAYSLRCGRQGVAVNVVITGNRFVPGPFGYANACDSGGEVWSGNVRDSDGATIGAA